MWSTIELRELRVFLTLADELHFGRTAERLHLTPSRVSQTLRALEQKLGGQLVERTSRHVELTALGQQFHAEVGAAYEQLTGVLQRTQAANRDAQKPIQLGHFGDPTAPEMVQVIKAFETRHPECQVQVAEVPIDDPFGPLHRGEMDLMVSWLPHGQPGLALGPTLTSEPRVLAVGADHPLAQQTAVSVEDLADHRVTRFETLPKDFHEVWVPSKTPSGRRIPYQLPSDQSLGDRGRMTSELVYLIAAGKIVHPCVPSFARYFGHPDIVFIPITDMPPLRSALVWRRGTTHPLVREFIRTARDVLEPNRSAKGSVRNV